MLILALVRVLLLSQARLVAENLALRQQLLVLRRGRPRPSLRNGDRLFWLALRRVWPDWRSSLLLVQPETVIRWHRRAWRRWWTWKSRKKGGRPSIAAEVFALIRRMASENRTWGAPRIRDELALLGHVVAASTVASYMPRPQRRPPSQTWRTFLANHMDVTAACDFFVVPTITFRLLFVFVVLSHDRRRILHFNVTAQPTPEWTARQLIEAFPGDGWMPRFLIHDRDTNYGDPVARCCKMLRLREVLTSYRSPWQNAYVERQIGSIRRECLDHMIVMGERHCRWLLTAYSRYHNEVRPHQSLGGNAPVPRWVQPPNAGRVVAAPELGGLHHRYMRSA